MSISSISSAQPISWQPQTYEPMRVYPTVLPAPMPVGGIGASRGTAPAAAVPVVSGGRVDTLT